MYGKYRYGGIEGISLELGQTIRQKITCHDDGVAARGGTMTSLFGKAWNGKDHTYVTTSSVLYALSK